MLQQNDPGRKWWRRWIWRKSSQGSQASLGSLGWYHQIQMNVFSRRWFKQDRAGSRFFLLQVCWGSSWWSWNCGHLLNKAREWLQLGIIPKNCTVAPEELLKSLRTPNSEADQDGCTPVHHVAQMGHVAAAAELHCAPVNVSGIRNQVVSALGLRWFPRVRMSKLSKWVAFIEFSVVHIKVMTHVTSNWGHHLDYQLVSRYFSGREQELHSIYAKTRMKVNMQEMGLSENVGYIPNEIAIFHRDNDH